MDMSSPNVMLLQQSVSTIQASIMQLHGKMDTLLAGGVGAGSSSSSTAGMSPQMIQMQQQMLQMQMMMNGGKTLSLPGGAPHPIRMKGDEIITIIASMVEEYDKKAGAGGDGLKEQIGKLQEKLETMQVLYDIFIYYVHIFVNERIC